MSPSLSYVFVIWATFSVPFFKGLQLLADVVAEWNRPLICNKLDSSCCRNPWLLHAVLGRRVSIFYLFFCSVCIGSRIVQNIELLHLRFCQLKLYAVNVLCPTKPSFQTAEAVWAVNSKSNQFDAQSPKTICFLPACTSITLSQFCISLLNWRLFLVSESTRLTVRHMMTQPGGNEHSFPLSACHTQMDCWDEDDILWVKQTKKEGKLISTGPNLNH